MKMLSEVAVACIDQRILVWEGANYSTENHIYVSIPSVFVYKPVMFIVCVLDFYMYK